MTFTTTQAATYLGAILAILIAVLDLWVFGKIGTSVDLILLGTGLGTLIGTSIPLVTTAVAARGTTP